MTAPVATVKAAAVEAVKSNPDAIRYPSALRTLTVEAFYLAYGRSYTPATDTKEYARIKWHVRRILNGDTGPGRGGAREGAGRPKVSE